jgi:hypothetical protein
MATAKNITILVSGHNIADAVTGFTLSGETEEIDVTTVASSGGFRDFVPGFKNGSLYVTGIFDSDTVNLDEIHDILNTAYTTGAVKNILASTGTVSVGAPALMLDGSQMDYETPIEVGGLILSNANFKANTGIKFGRWLMSELVTEETETNASIDNAASSSNGGFFQAHWFNDDATGIRVIVQHSTNDSVWADLAEVISGTRSTGGYTFALNPTNLDEIDFNGVTFTFITGSSTATDIQIKASLALTMVEAAVVLNASVDADVALATYTATSNGITVSFDEPGAAGDAYTLDTADGGNSTRTGATLAGGVDVVAAEHGSGSVSVTGTVNRYIRGIAIVDGGDTFLVSSAFARL